jgi:hypothetical protein
LARTYTLRRRVIRNVGLRTEQPPEVPVEPVDEAPDYDALLKSEVVEIATAKGIDATGTKAEIVARLQA